VRQRGAGGRVALVVQIGVRRRALVGGHVLVCPEPGEAARCEDGDFGRSPPGGAAGAATGPTRAPSRPPHAPPRIVRPRRHGPPLASASGGTTPSLSATRYSRRAASTGSSPASSPPSGSCHAPGALVPLQSEHFASPVEDADAHVRTEELTAWRHLLFPSDDAIGSFTTLRNACCARSRRGRARCFLRRRLRLQQPVQNRSPTGPRQRDTRASPGVPDPRLPRQGRQPARSAPWSGPLFGASPGLVCYSRAGARVR
jgi:hypothetical protein